MVATLARKNDARRPATPGAAMHDRADPATPETAGIVAKPLTKYPGGKNGAGIYQRLINLMPPHQCYIEAFLGSGAILRRKKPAARNIGIDLDAAVIERHGASAFQWPGIETRLLRADALRWLSEQGRAWQIRSIP